MKPVTCHYTPDDQNKYKNFVLDTELVTYI